MKQHSASCCDTGLCVRGQPPRACIVKLLHNQLFFKADDNAKLTASFSEWCLIGTISCYSGLVHCAAGFDSAVESRKKCGESYRWAKKSQTGHTLRTFITAGGKSDTLLQFLQSDFQMQIQFLTQLCFYESSIFSTYTHLFL